MYYSNMYMWNLKKTGKDDLIYRSEAETQMQRRKETDAWTPKGEREVGESGDWGLAYIHC